MTNQKIKLDEILEDVRVLGEIELVLGTLKQRDVYWAPFQMQDTLVQ